MTEIRKFGLNSEEEKAVLMDFDGENDGKLGGNGKWERNVRKRMDGLMKNLIELEKIVLESGKNADFDENEPQKTDFSPYFRHNSEKMIEKPVKTTENSQFFCFDRSSCLIFQLFSSLFLLFTLFAIFYTEKSLHSPSQQCQSFSISLFFSLFSFLFSLYVDFPYTWTVFFSTIGLITGYFGFYSFLWGKIIVEMLWNEGKRLLERENEEETVTPALFSEAEVSESERESVE